MEEGLYYCAIIVLALLHRSCGYLAPICPLMTSPESWCETQHGEILCIQQSMQTLLEGVQSFCQQQQHSTRVSEVHIESRCWSR